MQETVAKNTDSIDMVNKKQFCTFRLSNRLFGVDILDVKEINHEMEFTPIFHAPKEVAGYVNIRGQIHLVLDLRLLLGFESREMDSDSCMVIFKQSIAEPFGVLVDKIGDVVEVAENEIEDHLKSSENVSSDIGSAAVVSNLIEGVCKLQDNLLVILNAKNFLNKIEVGK